MVGFPQCLTLKPQELVVPFQKATIQPLDYWLLVDWLDGVRQEMTNGQPWQAARMAERLRRVSQMALTGW